MKKGKTRNRVLAWILTMAMVLTMTPVTAFAEEEWAATASADFSIDAHEHEHDGNVYNPWPENASVTTLSSGNYFLTEDVTLTAGVQIAGNVNLCLNGHTLTINPSASTNYKNLFYVNSGKTLSIYDCAGNGKITGGKGYNDGKNDKGGAIYLKEATLNLFGGSIEGNSATWGGAIFVDATKSSSTVNMYGGSIQKNNAVEGGGGIELENNTSTLNMYGGSIINNTVTNKNGGFYKGGGIHHLGILNIYGTRGDVQISGNKVAGVENNVYLRSGRVISIEGSMTADSRIGVSAYDVEKTNTATKVTSGYGSSASEITNFFMDRTHSNTTYALVQKENELQIVPHSHTWNYEVNETRTEIQAYCTNRSPQCGYYGTQELHENALTLTLSAADAPYSGSSYSGASVNDNITSITGDTVNVEYYKDSAKLDSAPTDAGTYTVKVTIGGATISSRFTISKVDAAYTAPTANTRTYDGTAQSLVSGGTATGGEMYYRMGTDGTWSTSVPTAKYAGEYDVYYYVKGDSNHNSIGSESSPIDSVKVTIGQKNLTEAMVSLEFTEKDYTGGQFAPNVTVKDMSGESNLITADDYTVSGVTEATEVGNYTITVTGKGNYTGSIPKDWCIKGLDFTASDISAANVTKTYDGSSYGISVSVTKSGVQDVEVRYKDDNGNYTLTECPTYSDASSTPYTIEYEVTAKGYNAYRNSATVTINPKEVELEWSNISLTYNGTEQKPTVNVKEDSLCGNDICTVILGEGKTDSNAKAGEASYSITVTGLDNSNYKLPSEAEQLTKNYTIAQKEVEIDWSNTTFTYDRASHKPTASLNGVVTNDTCNVTVTGERTNAGTNYIARASIDNANYKIKTSDVTTTFVINPKEITEDMISLNDTDSIYDFTNSEITPVVTVKDGEVVLTGGETGDYVLAGDLTGTAYGSYEITVSGKGNYTGTPKVVWNITDPNAPTGEIILKENKWNSFLNTITFGLFFKNTQKITVNATDGENESGVDKVYYCVSDTLLTDSASLDSAKWTGISNGGSFNINPNAKVCVYVKITDKVGNAAYISSKGIVVYTDSARDTDKITFTKTSAEDVTATVTLNGNTISKVTNGTTELTKGSHYTISADGATITFKASYLQTLSAGDYTINVSYNPMGETYVDAEGNDQPVDTSITLSVKRASSDNADTKITNKDNLSKEYNGQPTEAATPSSKNGSTPKVEYKKKGNPDSSFTEEVPKDAGNYVVRVTYPQDENYEETSVTEEFTISPKAVTAVVSVSTKTYNGTTDAEVTATVDTGITGQKLAITGLTGTFDNKNAGTGKTVTINSTNAQVTAGADTDASNYSITYPAESTGSIQAASLTIKVNDASKHIGKADPAFGYSVITGILVEGDSISGIIFTRTAGETAGTYDITATEKVGSNPNYNITITDGTLTIEDHTLVTDAAIAATCTETGLTEGKHCSVCNEVLVAQEEVAAKGHTEVVDEAVEATCTTAGKTAGKHCSVCEEVLVAQETVAALGHDWSGEWTIVKEATATTDGKRKTICTRDGCGQKKYETIPATGTPEEPENPNAGKLDKDAEVEPDAPIDEATLDNKKSELLDAPAIFTEAEKQQIQSGTDARVWLDVKRTDESSIPTEDKKEVTKEAEKIMGENPMITYFDADLFKQVEGGDKTQIHEPGIDIQVTILIPDELLNHDRTMVREYKIIRLHYDAVTGESKVDVLSGDFDRGTGEFSFKTDKFSTFAIAYTDIQLVTGITLTADSATLTGSGETVQLTAIVAPDNAVNKNVIWTSSDPNVATVDANGKVTAVGNGTCTITATTEDGSFTAICTIKVEIPDSDNGGNNGDNNSGDNNQSNEDANTPANTKEDKKPNVEAPKTGDASNVTLWSLLLALSALALAGIRVARRKRSSSIEK